MNSKFNLAEKVEDIRVVRKILRSFFERFHPKVSIIEIRNNLDVIKVEEVVGSLQIYESSLSQIRKRKSIALEIVKKD